MHLKFNTEEKNLPFYRSPGKRKCIEAALKQIIRQKKMHSETLRNTDHQEKRMHLETSVNHVTRDHQAKENAKMVCTIRACKLHLFQTPA